ncbi:MAG: lysostaphin resistance A-like protein [Ruminococcus sp.]
MVNLQYDNQFVPKQVYSAPEPSEDPRELKFKAEKKDFRKRANLAGLTTLVSAVAFVFVFSVLSVIFDYFVTDYNILSQSIDSIPDNIINSITSLTVFAVVGIIFLKFGKRSFSEALPFKRVSFRKLMALTVIGFSVCMLSNYLLSLYLQLFKNIGIDLNPSYISPVSDSSIEILVYFVSTAIVPAFSEEFVFRGVILSSLRKYGDSFAVLASAVLFSIMHGNFVQIPFTFLVGMILGYITVYTDSMLPAIIIHALNNGFSVLCDVMYSNSASIGISETLIDIVFMIVVAAGIALSLFFVMKLSKRDKNFLKDKKYEGELDTQTRFKLFFTSPCVIIAGVFLVLESVLNYVALL